MDGLIEKMNIARAADEATDQEIQNASEIEENYNSHIILSIYWKYGQVVASYYSIVDKYIYTIKETIDVDPYYPATQSLIRRLKPQHIITIGRMSDPFIQLLIDMIDGNMNIIDMEHRQRKLPKTLTLLDSKEFSYNCCHYAVKKLQLESQPTAAKGQADCTQYIQSLVNLESPNSIHMLGALIKFLEHAWRNLRAYDTDPLVFISIIQITLCDQVYIDNTTFLALNVFNRLKHDSSFKNGGASSGREGDSLFRMLSQHCSSKFGPLKLRELLVSPTKNIQELETRFDFMDFVVDPRNSSFVESFSVNAKKIANVVKILHRIEHAQGTKLQWKALYDTIYAILQIGEYVRQQEHQCALFSALAATITDNIYCVETCIESAMDFDLHTNHPQPRPRIKEGIDKNLDEAKHRYESMKNRVVAAARTMVHHLPPCLQECTVIYVPDLGHVISVKKWSATCQPDDLRDYGCFYLFTLNDTYLYKNVLCQELDNQLSGLPNEIQDHENRIIQRIATYVVSEKMHIISPIHIITYMDAVMSMAKVGASRGFVRPRFNDENEIEIIGGRHPLLECIDPNFVANDFRSGGKQPCKMKIITGPNSSGKSVYLKQTAMLVYMAHVGSYVPAELINIPPIHSIHTRLHNAESAALNMSAFHIDIQQMGNAFNAKNSSLVLVDEFGRGTTGNVSKALLIGALKYFLGNNDTCPHVMVATHMYIERSFLPSPLVLYQRTSYVRDKQTGQLTFLYKIEEGEARSCTFELANLPESVLRRAKEVYALLGADQEDPFANKDFAKKYFMNVNMPPADN